MKIYRQLQLALLVTACLTGSGLSQAESIDYGKWNITLDETTQMVALTQDGKNVLHDMTARFKYNSTIYQTAGYGTAQLSQQDFTNAVGSGKLVTILYQSAGKPNVEQKFYLFADRQYLLTDVTLSMPDGGEVASNYICPIFSEANNLFLPQEVANRFLTVPYDNDGFVTYGSFPLSRGTSTTSTASGRSVVLRITSTGFPSPGASS